MVIVGVVDSGKQRTEESVEFYVPLNITLWR